MGRRNKREGGERQAKRTLEWVDPATVTNESFNTLYRGNVIPEQDWDKFIACLRTNLPSSFRINTALPTADVLRAHILEQLAGEKLTRIAFVPGDAAFQTPAGRSEIKRDLAMKRVKKFLHMLNDEGYVSRQEAVSMIPPVLLDVQPGHRVLDMCAAPGSKTTQILERLVAQGPGGVVVANDINPTRLDVLTHQVARLPDAKSRLIITHHDATAYPLVLSAEDKFDRVLCDDMCSGDGTMRKNIDQWTRWTPLHGPHLHNQQAKVLLRGMGMCKVGGIVVYSTCSMNPVEDEAVIAKCLLQANGAFELMDPTERLPELRYYAGKHTWTLLSGDGLTVLRNADDAKAARTSPVPEAAPSGEAVNSDNGSPTGAASAGSPSAAAPQTERQRKQQGSGLRFEDSMFPPSADDATRLKLERCVRVVPHLQDTGGFFIAGLRCVAEMPKTVGVSVRSKYEHPMKPIGPDVLAQIRRSVQLPETFPFERLYCLDEGARMPKVFYATEDCAKFAATLNAKMVLMGVKVFESGVKKSWAHCRFTLEGASTIAHMLGPEALGFARVGELMDVLEQPGAQKTASGMHISFDLPQVAFRGVCTCADNLPSTGVLEVDCGEVFGKTHVLFYGSSPITIKMTATQYALLRHASGRPLYDEAKAADGDEDDSDSGDDSEVPAGRPQPAAEDGA
jgi:tRNA (cytosine34-C5)-methyltransferase